MLTHARSLLSLAKIDILVGLTKSFAKNRQTVGLFRGIVVSLQIEMWRTILIVVVLLAVAMLLMAVHVLLKPGGRFRMGHACRFRGKDGSGIR